MAQRGKIKSKVVRATIENRDVLDLFHGVLGTGEGTPLNLEIVYPKFREVARHCDRFVRLLEALRSSAALKRFEAAAAQLAAYAETLRAQAAESFAAPDLAALHPPTQLGAAAGRLVHYEDVTREEYDAFSKVYEGMKACNAVNTIVVTCKNLVPHKKSLGDPSNLKARFLTHTAGLSFAPLPDLPSLNFKQFYISDAMTPADKHFLLMILHKMLTVSHDVYDAISAPDIDVDEFIQVIMTSLDDVKKHIPRCDQAFDKIRESVGLLKGNFDGYYKDYVASNNPTIIMENFVLDVSKNTKSSPKITAQFRRIINHYRKLASQQAHHPKLKTLFQQVDKNFQELEKRSREADDSEASSSSSDEAPARAPAPGAEEPAEEPAGGPPGEPAEGAPGGEASEKAPGAAPEEGQERRKRRKRQKPRRKAAAPASAPQAGEGLAEGLAEEFARVEEEAGVLAGALARLSVARPEEEEEEDGSGASDADPAAGGAEGGAAAPLDGGGVPLAGGEVLPPDDEATPARRDAPRADTPAE